MKINITGWHSFVLEDLFEISRGQRQKSTDRISGDIPYYSASEYNNGMTD
ncbi:restriction endonuclease subunit S [Staphylococcus succinus]|nr:restriction endonuclease subunit S [Staphylococcus succinus]